MDTCKQAYKQQRLDSSSHDFCIHNTTSSNYHICVYFKIKKKNKEKSPNGFPSHHPICPSLQVRHNLTSYSNTILGCRGSPALLNTVGMRIVS